MPQDVLFINAAEHFVKGKRQNQLTDEHIAKIIDTYQFRKDEDRYSKRIDRERIAAEGYNLNISRYISTVKQEDEIDLSATRQELVDIEKRVREATAKHNVFLKEFGLPLLPGAVSKRNDVSPQSLASERLAKQSLLSGNSWRRLFQKQEQTSSIDEGLISGMHECSAISAQQTSFTGETAKLACGVIQK